MRMLSAGRRAVTVGLLSAALAGAAPGPVADDGAPRRVLFVGNSLTFYNEMPWMVAAALLQRSAWEAVRHGTRMPY